VYALGVDVFTHAGRLRSPRRTSNGKDGLPSGPWSGCALRSPTTSAVWPGWRRNRIMSP
jgi:hypothetical protein